MGTKRSSAEEIRVVGARENNLQNLTLSLPKHQFVALAGMSGAGKSTLAHHILARTARRRLGRLRGEAQFLAPAYEPDVDLVEGLPPCIEFTQEPLRGQSRSTVATYTGLLDLIAELFLHFGSFRSPQGSAVLPTREVDLSAWLARHHLGKPVGVASVRPDLTVTTAERLPAGTFYWRERRTAWAKATRGSIKSALPARWWIGEPEQQVKLKAPADVALLSNPKGAARLWIIDDIFIEEGVHRLAVDDPQPYEPLSRRLFSFNSTGPGGGQCPACAGLGLTQGVSERALIRSSKAPLLKGGLNLPQNAAGRFTHLGVTDDILRGLFLLRGIPADVSWDRCPEEVRQIVMHGSGDEPIPELPQGETRLRSAKRPFAGLIPLIRARARSSGPSAKVFQQWIAETPCPECQGSRFNRSARAAEWRGHRLAELVSERGLGELREVFAAHRSAARDQEAGLLRSLDTLIAAYENLNLGHLPLTRSTSTLSGGEAQRLKLGLGLALEMRDACYILDEPSRGLHAQDIGGIARILRSTINNRNTVIVVEHQPMLLRHAEHVVVLGPGGGSDGGRVIYQGRASLAPQENIAQLSMKGAPLAARSFVQIKNLNLHNLQDVKFRIPTGLLTTVVGVSGAGKSSAILKALVPAARGMLEGAGESPLCELQLPSSIRFVEVVGQKLATQNRRSVVATVLDILDPLREHFAAQPDAKALGLAVSDFSFNSTGACPACAGSGVARDGFGEETEARCHVCAGSRFSGSALLVRSKDCGIEELLQTPIATLVKNPHPAFDAATREKLAILVDLGLGYLSLGRATPTLSAGERQRLALARFLAKLESNAGSGLLVLDEPTAGLSVADARQVFARIQSLAKEQGHTAVVLEHKLDLLPLTDWILEFGPGGGPAGGRVVFEGEPRDFMKTATPTATAWKNRGREIATPKSPPALPDEKDVRWEACADVFEALAAHGEVRDEADLLSPIKPAARLNPNRVADDTRVGELLDLLPWLRSRSESRLPSGAQMCQNADELENALAGKAFGFSPVAPQLRLGLATPGDLQTAVRALQQLGFREALSARGRGELRHLPSSTSSADDLARAMVVCPADAPEPLRKTALRWSQGVIHLLADSRGAALTTQFLAGHEIGLSLASVFVGDWRSPRGRCAQCIGSGRLPTYPWKLIVADERRSIADDKFWVPAILDGLRALRRSRILPEAEFFAKQWVVDFRESPAKMDDRTRLLFEHGIPWRDFPKPSARRTDREQDHYSWRGLHDYVYLGLGRMTDTKHKQALKDGFRELPCPVCDGTGMGWEARYAELKSRTMRDIWRGLPMADWKAKLGCDVPALRAAVALDLGKLRADDRFGTLPMEQREKLLLASCPTAMLDGLTLVSPAEHRGAKGVVEDSGMNLVTATLTED